MSENQRRHRIDLSLFRRRQGISSTSSTSLSLSPPVPVLQSPVAFHALASHTISEATLKQDSKLNRAPMKPSMFFEEDQEDDDDGPAPNLTPGALKDGRPVRESHGSSHGDVPMTQARSQYFENVFSTRGPFVSPSTRINRDSLVVIEIVVNIKIKDEDSIVPRIITRMAQIYQKPESLMMVTIQQESCLRFGNSVLPAYSMKVFALPYLIAPITNLRSTILVQATLQEIFHISPSRGVILYIPVAEENMATNSITMMGEIARLERESHDQAPGILRSFSRSMRRRMKSSSSQSAALSVATNSSWNDGSEPVIRTAPVSESTDASCEEVSARPGRAPRSLRQLVQRRLAQRSGLTDDRENDGE